MGRFTDLKTAILETPAKNQILSLIAIGVAIYALGVIVGAILMLRKN